jgi:hypothetical protein
MRDNCLITVVLMLISIPATSQTSVSRVFPGTNLRIQLTDDFITSKTIPGFYQEADSTRIFAVQSNNNLSLDQFIAEHQKNLMGAGSIIKKTEKFKHHEFDAALIDYELTNSNYDGANFLLSTLGSQVIVASFFQKGKRKGIVKMLMTVKADEDIEIKKDIGFTAIEKSGSFVKVKSNTITADYEHRDSNNEVIGVLSLRKTPKNDFKSTGEFLETLSSRVAPMLTLVEDQNFESETGSAGVKRIYKGNRKGGGTKYIYLLVLEFENNYLVAIGSPSVLDDARYLDEIVRSVRIE